MLPLIMSTIWEKKKLFVAKWSLIDKKEFEEVISAAQNAKRNDLKSTLKFVFIALPAVGVMCGAALGVGLGMTFHTGISWSPLFIPLIVSGLGLMAIAWHYARKIDQL